MKFRYIIIWFIIYIHTFITETQGGLAKSEVSSNYMDEDSNSKKEQYINLDYMIDDENSEIGKANLKTYESNDVKKNYDVAGEDKLEKITQNNLTETKLTNDNSIKFNSIDQAYRGYDDAKLEENENSIKYRPFFNGNFNHISQNRNSSSKTDASKSIKKAITTISWRQIRELLNTKYSKKENPKSKGSNKNMTNKVFNKNNSKRLVGKNKTNRIIQNKYIKKQVGNFGIWNLKELNETVKHKKQNTNSYNQRTKTMSTNNFNRTTSKVIPLKTSSDIYKSEKSLKYVNLEDKSQKKSKNISYQRKIDNTPVIDNSGEQITEIFYDLRTMTDVRAKSTTPHIASKKIEATKFVTSVPTIRILALFDPMTTKKEKTLVSTAKTGKRICSVTQSKIIPIVNVDNFNKSNPYDETESTSDQNSDISLTKTNLKQDETHTTETIYTSELTTDKSVKASEIDSFSTKIRKTCSPQSAKIVKTSLNDKISSSSEETSVFEITEETDSIPELDTSSNILKTTIDDKNSSDKVMITNTSTENLLQTLSSDDKMTKTQISQELTVTEETVLEISMDFLMNTTYALSLLARGNLCSDSLPKVERPDNNDSSVKTEKTEAVSEFSTITSSTAFIECTKPGDDIPETTDVFAISEVEESQKLPPTKESILVEVSPKIEQTTVIIEFSKEYLAAPILTNLTDKARKISKVHQLSIPNKKMLEKSSIILEIDNKTGIKNPYDNTTKPNGWIKLNLNNSQTPGASFEMFHGVPVNKSMKYQKSKMISFLEPEFGKSVKTLKMKLNGPIDKIDDIMAEIGQIMKDKKLFKTFKEIKSQLESVKNKKLVNVKSQEKFSYVKHGANLNLTKNTTTTSQMGYAKNGTYVIDKNQRGSKTNKTAIKKYLKPHNLSSSTINQQHSIEFKLGPYIKKGKNGEKRILITKSNGIGDYIPMLKSTKFSPATPKEISKEIKQIKPPAESQSLRPYPLEIVNASTDTRNTEDKEIVVTNYESSALNSSLANVITALYGASNGPLAGSHLYSPSAKITLPYKIAPKKNNSTETEASGSVRTNYILSSSSQTGYPLITNESAPLYSPTHFKSTFASFNCITPCPELNITNQNIVKLPSETANFSGELLLKNAAPGELSSYYQLWKAEKNNSRCLPLKNGTCDTICIDDDKLEVESPRTLDSIFTCNKYTDNLEALFTSVNRGSDSITVTQGEKLDTNSINENFTATLKLRTCDYINVNITNNLNIQNATEMPMKLGENTSQSLTTIGDGTSGNISNLQGNLTSLRLVENTTQSQNIIGDKKSDNTGNTQESLESLKLVEKPSPTPTKIRNATSFDTENSQLPNWQGISNTCTSTTVSSTLPTSNGIATICLPIREYNLSTSTISENITTDVSIPMESSDNYTNFCTDTLNNAEKDERFSINSKPTTNTPTNTNDQYCNISIVYNTKKPSNISTISESNQMSTENKSKVKQESSAFKNLIHLFNAGITKTSDDVTKNNNKPLKGASKHNSLRIDALTSSFMLQAKTILNEQRNFVMHTASKINNNSWHHSKPPTVIGTSVLSESQKNETATTLHKTEQKLTTRKKQFLIRVKGKDSSLVQSFPKVIKVVGGERYLSKVLSAYNFGPIKEVLVNLTIADNIHVNGSLKCIYSDNELRKN